MSKNVLPELPEPLKDEIVRNLIKEQHYLFAAFKEDGAEPVILSRNLSGGDARKLIHYLQTRTKE